MPTRPDRAWIEGALREYEAPLTFYATRLLGDVDLARDVVQDAFLKLWQADRSRVDGHLVKWLYTVTRNRAIDVKRKGHRMKTLTDCPVEAVDRVPRRDSGDERGDSIAALVDGLPPRQREAVQLKFQGGLSYREIADVMGTNANNVGVIIHMAIKSLRSRVNAAPDAPLAAAPNAHTA